MPIKFDETFPETLEEAIDIMFNSLNEVEFQLIKENEPAAFHLGLGMHLRNGWNLWKQDFPLTKHFQKVYGLGHADDMSAMILAGLFARVKEESFDPHGDAKYYKEYWRKQSIDPLTLKQII